MKKTSGSRGWGIRYLSALCLCLLALSACRYPSLPVDGGRTEPTTQMPSSTGTQKTVQTTTASASTSEPAAATSAAKTTTRAATATQQETTAPPKTTIQNIDKDHPYLIKVNKQANCVTVFGQDENGEHTIPVKAMACSTGEETPLGTFHTSNQYRWRALIHNVWGQYATRITGSILFHSVPYLQKDPATLQAEEYNKLGVSASAGCVRLRVIDAKWILDYCPKGTTVVIYNDEAPGPLGKPSVEKIPVDSQWDPTDPDPNNPWHDSF